MKSYSIAIASAALAAAFAVSASPARAQAEPAAAAVAAPVIVKTIGAVTPKPKPPGTEWLRGEVIHADAQEIVFRERGNDLMIHTFTVSPALRDKMQAIVDQGGYQYGDHVKVLHQHGQTVALRVSGKHSKPS